MSLLIGALAIQCASSDLLQLRLKGHFSSCISLLCYDILYLGTLADLVVRTQLFSYVYFLRFAYEGVLEFQSKQLL